MSWIHANRIEDNLERGLHFHATVEVPARAPRRSVIYSNHLSRNGDYPVRVSNPSSAIYLLFNEYDANVPNELRVDAAEVFVCPGSQDEGLPLAGAVRLTASALECDLGSVAGLFDLVLHRRAVDVRAPDWRESSFPLTAANDDEIAPFPHAAIPPSSVVDALPAVESLVIYRLLTRDGAPVVDQLLLARSVAGEVELSWSDR